MVKINQVNKHKETALTSRDIIAHSFPLDRRNTRFVAPSSYAKTPSGYKITTVTKIGGQRSRLHKVLIDMDKDFEGEFNDSPSVKILCDCMRFLYVWNWALHHKDAAIKDLTNGEPPVITNPGESPGVCKHGVVALRLLQRTNPIFKRPAKKANSPSNKKPIALTSLDTGIKRARKGES
jgi:hypothetical protein